MKVGFVQINNSFSGAHYLPLSVGMLQAYVKEHLFKPDDCEFLLPVYKKISVGDAVQNLIAADVVGFSTYVWNARRSLAIAEALKREKPSITIVFGGPHVPDPLEDISHEHGHHKKELPMAPRTRGPNRTEMFLRRNPFIDILCHGEGERAFAALLEGLSAGTLDNVPSVSFLDPDGVFRKNQKAPRIAELSEAPSPYLSGVFDSLMNAYPEQEWLAMWETNRGCPFSCGYCDWGSATADKVYKFDMRRLQQELEWFAEKRIEFIFCCDANFGLFQRDVDIARYAADVKHRRGYPKALSVQNAKNSEERIFEAQKTLADAGLNKGVTLAFESLNPKTLEAIKRKNIRLRDFQNLQARFTKAGIATYCDFIIAMPEESYESFAEGISRTIEMGQHNRIQFGNLSILPNTEMADPEYQKRYGMRTQEVRSVMYHGAIGQEEDGIDEIDELVVATSAMPAEDWVRTRAFCWTAGFLHFDKIFQIPLIILRQAAGMPYRALIELFTESPCDNFPTLRKIREFFQNKARSIQEGGVEYCPAPEWLNIYWPADEYLFIRLCREGKLGDFYAEAEMLINRVLGSKKCPIESGLLSDAIRLNHALIKLPFQSSDVSLSLSWNIMDVYRGVLKSELVELKKGTYEYVINRTSEQWDSWEDWMRYVVWYGNKKGAYLYGNVRESQERAGHF